MSLKLNKHMLLVLAVLLMLVIIPTTFAEDAGDANVIGVNNASAVDVVSESAVGEDLITVENDVNEISQSAVESQDVLEYGEEYITTPSPTSVSDYKIGDSQNIVVSVSIDDYCKGEIEDYLDNVYVIIDDDYNNKIIIPDVSTTASAFNYNLNTLTSEQLSSGTHTLKFGVAYQSLENWGYSTAINPLTVTVVSSSSGDGEEETGNVLYVDASASSGGDGSKESPYNDLDSAVTASYTKFGSDGGKIIVKEGEYQLTSNGVSLRYNLDIVGEGDVVIKAKSSQNHFFLSNTYSSAYTVNLIGLTLVGNGAVSNIGSISATNGNANIYLNIINTTIKNVQASYSIIATNSPTVIQGCTFVNDRVTASAATGQWTGFITTRAATGSLDIANNIFIGNTVASTAPFINNYGGNTAVANNNYWGTNDGPSGYKNINTVTDNWVVLDITASDIPVESSNDIVVEFKSTSDGNTFSTLQGYMNNFTVDVSSSLGTTASSNVNITNNKGIIKYTSGSEIDVETLTLKYNNAEIASASFKIFDPTGKVYVSTAGSDVDGDGSFNNPYASITNAYSKLGDNTAIVIKEGDYEISSSLNILKNVELIGEGEVNIISKANIVINAPVNITNVNFVNSTRTTLIQGAGKANINIDYCSFINNDVTQLFNILSTGQCNINNSVLANNTGDIIKGTTASKGNISNSFLGTNDEPETPSMYTLNNYVIAEITIAGLADNELSADVHDIEIVLKLNNGDDLTTVLPSFKLNLKSENETVDTFVDIVDNKATATYVAENEGSDKITVSAGNTVLETFEFNLTESEEGKIFVDAENGNDTTGDGSRKNPYATITQAVAVNNAGAGGTEIIVYSGTYTGFYTISKDVTITGRGNVVLDLNGYYFGGYTSTTGNVALNNLLLTNAGRQTIFQYAKDLTINNCTVSNSAAQFIDVSGKVSIKNTLFENLTYASNVAPVKYSGSIEIVNSVFNNVTYAYSYMMSGSGASINGNFWGTNDKPTKILSSTYASALTSWVVAIPSFNVTSITAGETPTLTVKFMLTSDGENYAELTDSLPTTTLGLTSAIGNTFTPEKVTLTDNVGTVTYNALTYDAETVNVTSGDNILYSLEFDVEQPDDGKTIFVDAVNGNDTTADGSKAKPYQTLEAALNAVSDTKQAVVLKEGNYTVSDYTINHDVSISWSKKTATVTATDLTVNANVTLDNLVFTDGNAITLTENNNLTITNTTFINSNGVVSSKGNLIIKESKFINNTAGENGVISVEAGNVNIKYSEFAANTGVLVYSTVAGDINDNYWGSNDAPNVSEIIKPTSWVALVISLEEDTINASEVQKISIDFKNTTDGGNFTDLNVAMPTFDITVEAEIGSVDKTDVTIKDNTASTTYTATTEGAETINFKAENNTFETLEFDVGKSVAGKIFVATWGSDTTGDGSRLKPFATINKAVDSAQSGNEIVIFNGTYDVTSYVSIYKNLAFTGEGEVILINKITSTSYPYMFSISGYTVTFTNLIFANATAHGSSSYYYSPSIIKGSDSSSSYTRLNVINCTFDNNEGDYGVIYGPYMYANILGSKFINNKATGTGAGSMMVYVNRGSLNITNSVFLGNEQNYRYLVYTYGDSYVKVDVNYNFWGSNDKPTAFDPTYSAQIPTYWVVVNATIDSDTITATETHDITVTFNATNGDEITKLNGFMPEVTLNVASILNTVNDTVTISDNVGNIIYNAVRDGDEKITVSSDIDLAVLTFVVREFDDGSKIFVDSENGNDDNNGSQDAPYKSLTKALERNKELGGGRVISIQEGSYEIANFEITDDAYLEGKKTVVIKANNLTVNANVTFNNLIFDNGDKITVKENSNLTILDSTFTNNNGVIESEGNLLINHTKFVNNTAIDNKGVINALGGSINITYSEFVDCNNGDVIVYSDVAGDVNDNYWGVNDEIPVSEIIKPSTWIKLNATIDETVFAGNNADINIKFVFNDGSELSVVMPELNITLTPAIGSVNPVTVTLTNNIATAGYNSQIEGDETVIIGSQNNPATNLTFEVVEDETGKIFVATTGDDTNGDGSKANPYATITKALTVNTQRGGNQEIIVMNGTYTTSSYYNIGAKVTITGRGEVRLTRTGTGYLFNDDRGSYYAGYDFTLNNLIIENVTSTQYGIIYYHGYGTYYGTSTYTNLNVINCTFINNKAPYGVIYGSSYANLNATGNIFINNSATSQSVITIQTANKVDVNYNIFLNNAPASNYYVVAGPNAVSNADYNFWGSNNAPVVYKDYRYGVTVNNWIVAELTIDNDDLAVGDNATVNVVFKYTTDGENYNDLTKSMPAITLDLGKVLGEVSQNVTIENNIGTANYNATTQGDEVITLTYDGKEITNLTFYVDESPIGKIFVDENAEDNGDGSRTAPYKTIAEAIAKNTALGGNQTIVIRKGNYELSNAEIKENLTIKADDEVIIDGNNGNVLTISENANVTLINVNIVNAKDAIKTTENTNLEIINSTFENNDGVLVSEGKTTIYRTLFNNNDGTVIVNNGELDVSYSVFINNNELIKSTVTVNANNNFWGSNDKSEIENVTIDNYVIINATLSDAPDIKAETNYPIDIKLTSDDESELADTLPEFEIQLTTSLGTIDETVTISDNKAAANFITNDEGEGEIDIAVGENIITSIEINATEDETGKIYVSVDGNDTTGNGSKANPYATLTEALKHVNSANNTIIISEGVYILESGYYNLNNDVNIIGRGEVILTKTTSTYLFQVAGYKKASFTNIVFTNCTSTSYAGVFYVAKGSSDSWTELIIDNCTFVNNKGPSAIIYNQEYGIVTITHSNIMNNVATGSGTQNGIIGSYYDLKLTMNYNNLINNTYSTSYYIGTNNYVSGNVDYNFWGSNDAPTGLPYGKYTLNYWVGIIPSIDTTKLYAGDEYNVNVEFKYKAYDTEWLDLVESMPDLTVGIASVLSEDIPNTVTISNNIGNITYTSAKEGNETLTFTVAGVEVGTLEFEVTNPLSVEVVKYNEGENVTIIVTAENNITADGTVVFNNEEYPISLINGTGNITIKDVLPGIYNADVNIGVLNIDTAVEIKLREFNITFEITNTTVDDETQIKVIPSLESVTGDIIVHVNGVEYTATKDNNYTITPTNLKAGNVSVVASYYGDDYHKYSFNSTSFEIAKLNTTIDAVSEAIKEGEVATINITVPTQATGYVLIEINGKTYYAAIKEGNATVTIPDLTAGTYEANITYVGDDKYDVANKTVTIIVNEPETVPEPVNPDANITIPTTIEINGDNNITIELPADATGNLTVKVDGRIVYDAEANKTNNVSLGDLTAGDHIVEVIYSGDENYTAVSETKEITVEKLESQISADSVELTEGETATITVNITEGATGVVLIDINGNKYYGEINGNTAVVTVNGLTNGNYTATITYNGDDKYNETAGTVEIKVNAIPQKEEVTPVIELPETAVIDENPAINITLPADATGNVTVKVDGREKATENVIDGKVNVPLDDLTAGDHIIEIIYSGDDKYIPTTLTKDIAITKVITTLSATSEEIDEGETLIITVTVNKETKTATVRLIKAADATNIASTATGIVLVQINDNKYYADVINGIAKVTINGLKAGEYSASITYLGDDKFNLSTTLESVTVKAVNETPEIVKEDANATVSVPFSAESGETPVVNVTLPADATGNVTVLVDGKEVATVPVVNGSASVPLDNLSDGAHVVEVKYSGDDKYAPESSTSAIAVTEPVVIPQPVGDNKTDAGIDLTVPVEALTNETPVATATLPKDATGNVTVLVDGKEIATVAANETINLPLDNLTPGAHAVEIKYSGDDKYAPASTAKAILVTEPVTPEPAPAVKEDANITVDVPSTANAGETPTATVNLPKDATGNVTVLVDGKEVATVPVANGTANLPLTNLTDGAHVVEVKYSGDDKYSPESSTSAIAVSAPAPTPAPAVKKDTIIYADATLTRVANDHTKTGENGTDYSVTLKDTDGNALVNKTIQIAINGVHYYVQTDSEGKAHQTVSMESANVYTYAFAFQGDDDYNAAPLNSTRLTVTKKATTITAKSATFKKAAKSKKVTVTLGTVKNADGKVYLASGKQLTLKVNGKTYKAKTNAKNQATFTIKLTKKGSYKATVKFAGSKIYAASSKKITIKIK